MCKRILVVEDQEDSRKPPGTLCRTSPRIARSLASRQAARARYGRETLRVAVVAPSTCGQALIWRGSASYLGVRAQRVLSERSTAAPAALPGA